VRIEDWTTLEDHRASSISEEGPYTQYGTYPEVPTTEAFSAEQAPLSRYYIFPIADDHGIRARFGQHADFLLEDNPQAADQIMEFMDLDPVALPSDINAPLDAEDSELSCMGHFDATTLG
jgi:hypothetical protein